MKITKGYQSIIKNADPFMISDQPTDSQIKWAQWFKDITSDMSPPYHIRRVHYRTLGKLTPDRIPYENNDTFSGKLGMAATFARYLGLVDFDDVIDNKNEGDINPVTYSNDYIRFHDIEPINLELPEIDKDDLIKETYGSEIDFYAAIRQPYHLIIFIEKSTMNDILSPLSKHYNASLITASGHMSNTIVKNVFNDIKKFNKPTRIFYIRDNDPAGESMPRAVSRKLEWFIRKSKLNLDVQLFDVLLSHEQCEKYDLPHTPLKEKDIDNPDFKYATELDALEAKYPGEFKKILDNAIAPFFDESLSQVVRDAEEKEIRRYAEYKQGIIDKILQDNSDKIDELLENYGYYVTGLDQLNDQLKDIVGNPQIDFQIEIPDSSKVVGITDLIPILNTKLSYDEQLELYHGTYGIVETPDTSFENLQKENARKLQEQQNRYKKVPIVV